MLLLFVLFSGDLMNSILNFKMVMTMMMMMMIHITNIINEFYCNLQVKFKRKKLPQEKQKRSLKGNSSFRQDSNPCIPDTGQQLSATN